MNRDYARRNCLIKTICDAWSRRTLWLPCSCWPAPVDALEQHRQLCIAQMHDTTRRLRPHEPTALQPLRVQVHAITAPPQQFHQITAPPTEDEQIAREDILLQRDLHQRGQSIHASPQVGHPGGEPDAGAGGQADHERRARQSSTSRNAVASGTPQIRTVARANMTSMLGCAAGAACSGVGVCTGNNVTAVSEPAVATGNTGALGVTKSVGSGTPNFPARYSRRHLNSWFALTLCSSASFATEISELHAAAASSRLNSTARFGQPFRVGRRTPAVAKVAPTIYLVDTTLDHRATPRKTAFT